MPAPVALLKTVISFSTSIQHKMPTVFVQVHRRLGAAREALDEAAGTSRVATVSQIQKTAAKELLSDAVAEGLTGEDVARISDMITDIQWAPGHEEELLQILSSKAKEKRRKQQDFCYVTNYFAFGDWTNFLDPNSELHNKADFLVNFVATKMDCINPTEHSYKKWTSEIIAAHFDKDTCRSMSKQSKFALMEYVKKEHKKIVANKPPPAIYMLQLPKNPTELLYTNQTYYENLYCAGESPVKNRLDEDLVTAIDSSFTCRGHSKSASTSLSIDGSTPPAPTGCSQLLAALPQLLSTVVQAIQPNTMEPRLTFTGIPERGFNFDQHPRGAKRSLRNLRDDTGESHRMRRLRIEELPSPGESPRPRIEELPEEEPPRRPEERPFGAPRPLELATVAASPDSTVLIESDDEGETVLPPAQLEPSTSKRPGDIMLDAILAREVVAKELANKKSREARQKQAALLAAEKAAEREQAAAEREKAKKEAGTTLSGSEPAPLTEGARSEPKKADEGNATRGELGTKPLTLSHSASNSKSSTPSISHEKSRFQFLVRYPGQTSEKFRYKLKNGEKAEFSSEADAKRAAELCLQQALELSAK